MNSDNSLNTIKRFERNLYGYKVSLVDDIIASGNPKTDSRKPFARSCNIKEEDIYFSNAYEPALKLINNHSEIKVAILDIRIPKKSEDLDDYNPEDPTQGWGTTLLRELRKRYREEELGIILITAYNDSDFSDPSILSLVDGYYKKPLDHEALAKKIEEIITQRWKKKFDYNSIDSDLSSFLKEKTREINTLLKRTLEDTIKIGQNFIEVKKKLGHGNFLDWVEAEIGFSNRTVRSYINVAERFKFEEISELNIPHSALVALAAPSTPEEATEEAITRAKQGEKISTGKAKKIKEKYLKQIEERRKEKNQARLLQKIDNDETSRELKPVVEAKTAEFEELGTPKQKQVSLNKETTVVAEPPKILKVTQNVVRDSFWNLGDRHKLFCGEPKNKSFLNILPKPIAYYAAFPPNNDYSLIPSSTIDTISSFATSSTEVYSDDIEAINAMLKISLGKYTAPNDAIAFFYLYDLELLNMADKLEVNAYIAEPNLKKCEEIIEYWRKKGQVKRFTV